MTKRLFVGNLSAETTESDLLELFGAVAAVKSVQIVMDSTTGLSGGFGFVEMKTTSGAEHAIAKLNESTLHNNRIKVGVVNQAQLPQGRIPEPPRKTVRKTSSRARA
jgi:RNA recognition motif-containing protein